MTSGRVTSQRNHTSVSSSTVVVPTVVLHKGLVLVSFAALQQVASSEEYQTYHHLKVAIVILINASYYVYSHL